MNQNSDIRRDTIKTIRRRIKDDTTANLGCNLLVNAPDTNNLVVSNSSSEASSNFAKPSIRIIAKMNNSGVMSYIYLDANGDTIMIDTPFVDEATDTVPMISTFYPSDTIKASEYQFGNMSYASVSYPSSKDYHPYKMTNDDIAQSVFLPLMILMTVAYFYKAYQKKCWTNFANELKEAWAA